MKYLSILRTWIKQHTRPHIALLGFLCIKWAHNTPIPAGPSTHLPHHGDCDSQIIKKRTRKLRRQAETTESHLVVYSTLEYSRGSCRSVFTQGGPDFPMCVPLTALCRFVVASNRLPPFRCRLWHTAKATRGTRTIDCNAVAGPVTQPCRPPMMS